VINVGLTEDELRYPIEDQNYILARKQLIPEASAYADSKCEKILNKEKRKEQWSKEFMKRMDYLAREKGLVKGGI
jgi:hypothetical protein